MAMVTVRPLCFLVLCLAMDLATPTPNKAMNVLMLAADDLRPQLNCFAPETWVGERSGGERSARPGARGHDVIPTK